MIRCHHLSAVLVLTHADSVIFSGLRDWLSATRMTSVLLAILNRYAPLPGPSPTHFAPVTCPSFPLPLSSFTTPPSADGLQLKWRTSPLSISTCLAADAAAAAEIKPVSLRATISSGDKARL